MELSLYYQKKLLAEEEIIRGDILIIGQMALKGENRALNKLIQIVQQTPQPLWKRALAFKSYDQRAIIPAIAALGNSRRKEAREFLEHICVSSPQSPIKDETYIHCASGLERVEKNIQAYIFSNAPPYLKEKLDYTVELDKIVGTLGNQTLRGMTQEEIQEQIKEIKNKEPHKTINAALENLSK